MVSSVHRATVDRVLAVGQVVGWRLSGGGDTIVGCCRRLAVAVGGRVG